VTGVIAGLPGTICTLLMADKILEGVCREQINVAGSRDAHDAAARSCFVRQRSDHLITGGGPVTVSSSAGPQSEADVEPSAALNEQLNGDQHADNPQAGPGKADVHQRADDNTGNAAKQQQWPCPDVPVT
jgi:hypothetical protein